MHCPVCTAVSPKLTIIARDKPWTVTQPSCALRKGGQQERHLIHYHRLMNRRHIGEDIELYILGEDSSVFASLRLRRL
jgi:hypothetical protein